MKKVLVAYVSRTGNTEKMAEFISEGIRMTGQSVEMKKIAQIKNEKELDGFDGYVFGCPTYHRDLTAGMKTFLFLAQKAEMAGKVGGAFGSYTHSGESAQMIYDTMQHVFKMDTVDLGSLNLKEQVVASGEGQKACQDYGREIGKKLG
ncbi:MAG: nitric oxide synthase [Deltaproteobacteria bacterium SG8_13]|nr:MAG: nitric oxide synthase [Deltaproteobacteria bacterium SG8_13]